ncbi:MAG: cobalamin-dependent protein [Ilumatobacteraceae bacterium]
MDDDAEHLDLQQAADVLGVHYQTAYRWVRSGRLPARLVAGQYRVGRVDLERVDHNRHRPIVPRPPGSKRLHHQVERMYEALLDGDETEALRISQRLVGDGTQVVMLVQTVLAPALRRIGAAWHDGDMPIWAEHRASNIAGRVLAELSPNPRGRRRGVVAVAAVTGDHHSLPTMMATVALREANWHVHHLGADTPPDEFFRFCTDHAVDVAVLSVTNPASAGLAEQSARDLRAAGIRTVVGGPGRTLDELLIEVRTGQSVAPARPPG